MPLPVGDLASDTWHCASQEIGCARVLRPRSLDRESVKPGVGKPMIASALARLCTVFWPARARKGLHTS